VVHEGEKMNTDDMAYGAPEAPTSEQEAEAVVAGWALGEYANGDTGCTHCGRHRLCLCPNGKHRCEKCNWSPELNDYAPVNDWA